MSNEEKKQQLKDETDRIPIEGKFGNLKRKGTLQRIMAKLSDTAVTVIGVSILAMNLDQLLRQLYAQIAWLMSKPRTTPTQQKHYQRSRKRKNQSITVHLLESYSLVKWAA
jgi:hypothetical protein